MTQIGQSWAKHGFLALQQNICNFTLPGQSDQRRFGRRLLGPLRSPVTNQGPNLGSRRLINPTTGDYDGSASHSRSSTHSEPATPIDHGLQVKESDLTHAPGRATSSKGITSLPTTPLPANGNNNVSHIEVRVTQRRRRKLHHRECPARVRGQRSAKCRPSAPGPTPISPSTTAPPTTAGSLSPTRPCGSRARRTATSMRVYNMNSDRGVRSFSIPVGNAQVANIRLCCRLLSWRDLDERGLAKQHQRSHFLVDKSIRGKPGRQRDPLGDDLQFLV